MKKFLMKIKVNMLIVLIISLLGGMAGSYFFNNRWLGLIVSVYLSGISGAGRLPRTTHQKETH